eukprot:TRINITY_DN7144_c0_g1_i6.p1 TRINITY_DN7144_c0_g1~~TRINITY_DN7144_c0_g1_i6.p1  ORF type:complete len:835 (+),score=158.11 TRINITY_DN7144_c0_g1_i6:58-2505(+)
MWTTSAAAAAAGDAAAFLVLKPGDSHRHNAVAAAATHGSLQLQRRFGQQASCPGVLGKSSSALLLGRSSTSPASGVRCDEGSSSSSSSRARLGFAGLAFGAAVAAKGCSAGRRSSGYQCLRRCRRMLLRSSGEQEAGVGERFRKIAQPYFVPSDDGTGAGTWLSLLAALLVGVVSGSYWLLLLLGTAVKAVAPSMLGPDAISSLAAMGVSSYYAAAGVGLAGALSYFYVMRDSIKGSERQWLFLGLLLFLLFSVTGLNVVLSYVFRAIDNVLVAKEAEAFYSQLRTFAVVLVVAVPIIGSYRWTRLTLAREWRGFLTRYVLNKYMACRSYYVLDSNSSDAGGIDNPDQRITEDVDYFTRETLDFLLDILDSILNLFSFAAILWATSKDLTTSLVLYAFVGTAIAVTAASQLIRLNALQLRKDADLRYSLVHIRDNAEAIAFYGGEKLELMSVDARLGVALENLGDLINWTTGLGVYQSAFFYLARLVPYLVIGGLYFAGEVDFGTLGQGQFAFSMVLSSVTLIVSRIQDISRFSAGITRLGAFLDVLERTENKASAGADTIETIEDSNGTLRLQGLSVQTPDGSRSLLRGLDLALGDGKQGGATRLLVVGASGVGKSSVLRAIAGLWTRGSGQVVRPPAGEAMFLPQRPYMPLGDLRTQLVYPDVPAVKAGDTDSTSKSGVAEYSDEELETVLSSLRLGDLPARFSGGLEAVNDWARTLSLGEQQRLAAARCLLRKPKLAVLDEATSALPVKDEKRLYDRFRELGISYLSVGHRKSLLDYHDTVLELQGNGGDWRVMSCEEYTAESEADRATVLA